MSKIYSPRIVTDSLVMCLDPSQNKSYPTTDLPVKNGLVMWMDAADDTTFSYSSGTTVSQWRDKSGFNYHMVPVTTGPTRNAFLNSRKVLAFTTSQNIANLPFSMETSANTVFVVSRLTGTTNARVLTAYYNNWLLGHWGGLVNPYYAEGWVYYSSNAADTVWRMYMGEWGGPSNDVAAAYSNGTVLNFNTNQASAGPKGLGINISGTEQSTCEVAEIIVFNRLLSTRERNLIHTYLGQKWGISNTDRSIIDLSGNDDNGLLGNGTTANMPVFDYYNKGGLKFDGANDFIQYPSLLNLGNSFTINFWIKPTSNARQTIVSNGYPYLANKGFFLVCPGNNATDMFLSLGNDQKSVQSNTGAITTGVIQMVTAVVNGLTNLMRLYVNGVEVSYAVQNDANVSLQYDSGIFVTGKRDTTSADYLSSHLYALQIYSRGLSAAEVFQNYNSQKSKFDNTIVQQGLVLNLDAGNPYSYAGSGTTWFDVSGAVNDFASVNSPTYSVDQFILNGTTQYFSISAASGFFISSANNFYADVGYAWTISVWFKFPVSPTSIRDATVNGGNCSYCMFGNSGGIGGGETLSLFVSGISGTTAGFHPYYCIVGLRGAKTQLSIDPVNTNVWNNVVVTWNGSAGRGYFNGVDRGVLNNNVGAGLQVSGYTIGTTGGGASGHLFEGSISQTFVYNRAISAAEVLQNYNATKGRFGL